jgi:hypothetical protein
LRSIPIPVDLEKTEPALSGFPLADIIVRVRPWKPLWVAITLKAPFREGPRRLEPPKIAS